MKPHFAPILIGLASQLPHATAHDGHGFSGLHWHATDTWGFVTVAAAIALLVWLRSK